jgi:hypothetical protein
MSSYQALVERTGELDDRGLRSDDGLVVERSGERAMRTFRVCGHLVVAIFWGGAAESRLVASKGEATRGTAFDA